MTRALKQRVLDKLAKDISKLDSWKDMPKECRMVGYEYIERAVDLALEEAEKEIKKAIEKLEEKIIKYPKPDYHLMPRDYFELKKRLLALRSGCS